MRLTESGKTFYQRCQNVLSEMDAAIAELNDQIDQPSGQLTVTAPQDFGTSQVSGAVAAFIRQYPNVNVKLIYEDRTLDFVEDHIDIAIHVGWLKDSTAKARRIGRFEQYLVCSPEYLLTINVKKPNDLKFISWVSNGALDSPLQWVFSNGKRKARVTGNAVVTTNGTPFAYACVLQGVGVTVLPDFVVAADITAGKLVRLLPEWKLRSGGIYIVFPPGRYRSAIAQTFADTLITQLSQV